MRLMNRPGRLTRLLLVLAALMPLAAIKHGAVETERNGPILAVNVETWGRRWSFWVNTDRFECGRTHVIL